MYFSILIFIVIPFCNFIDGVDFIVNDPLTHFYFNSTVYLVSPISAVGLNFLTLK